MLGLSEVNRDDDHILLESPGFQLVVHRIPGQSAMATEASEPPARRARAAFKPVFFVPDLGAFEPLSRRTGV